MKPLSRMELESIRLPRLWSIDAAAAIDRAFAARASWDEFAREIDPRAYSSDRWREIVRIAARHWIDDRVPLPVKGFMPIFQLGVMMGGRQEFSNVNSYSAADSGSTYAVQAVFQIRVKAWGGGGCNSTAVNSRAGGGGGYAGALINVVPFESLTKRVGPGGQGHPTSGVANGGGGASWGGGGAGYTGVFRASTPLLIAGGGGGGGRTGTVSQVNTTPIGLGGVGGGGGGNAGANGANGTSGDDIAGGGGGAGTSGAGGAGGSSPGTYGSTAGASGSSLAGGNGGDSSSAGVAGGGGGGGGGYYGGGGGGGGSSGADTANGAGGGGGGGGSSYAEPSAASVSLISASGATAANNSDADYVALAPSQAANSGYPAKDGFLVIRW